MMCYINPYWHWHYWVWTCRAALSKSSNAATVADCTSPLSEDLCVGTETSHQPGIVLAPSRAGYSRPTQLVASQPRYMQMTRAASVRSVDISLSLSLSILTAIFQVNLA